ncbi:MAG: CcmD family protein [Desulfovibrio sp.]|jgi:CcmD family protein|nr:CcmD family protein [Desulfovibrio sp.]
MDNYQWIMYAGLAVWIGLGLYLYLLTRRQTLLSGRISRIEEKE